MVQLEESRRSYEERGYRIAAISYDSPALLEAFADRAGIGFPLLSDPDSATIKAFGLLNTDLPADHEFYGVPHPGTYLIDPNGRITAKYFETAYQERFTPATILSLEFGVTGGPTATVETDHLRLTSTLAEPRARIGNRMVIDFEIELPDRMHVYAPGVTGYRPLALVFDANPNVQFHDATFPESEAIYLPAIDETVPVYHDRVRFRQELTILASTRASQVQVKGKLDYQACNDEICFLPTSVPLSFTIDLESMDRERAPENLRRRPGG